MERRAGHSVRAEEVTTNIRRVGKGAQRRAHADRQVTKSMSRYRRAKIEGGAFFFTVALANRSSDLLIREINRLRHAYKVVQERLPFETIAICVLPDHLHALWLLPNGDADFSSRWSLFKSDFSRGLPAAKSRSASKIKSAKREFGSAAIGNTPSEMMLILTGISTTSTTIRSNTDLYRGSLIGRTPVSTAT